MKMYAMLGFDTKIRESYIGNTISNSEEDMEEVGKLMISKHPNISDMRMVSFWLSKEEVDKLELGKTKKLKSDGFIVCSGERFFHLIDEKISAKIYQMIVNQQGGYSVTGNLLTGKDRGNIGGEDGN